MKNYLVFLICLLYFYAHAQEETFTITGHVNYKSPKDSVLVKLNCADGRGARTYTDSLGNYVLTRIVNKNLKFGINKGRLECAVLFEPPDYKRCGHCPNIMKDVTIVSAKPRRISIAMDSLRAGMVIDATITEEMREDQLPATVLFNKNSPLFVNFFSSDTLLDCVADYLLNCDGCSMEIAGYADSKESDKRLLSEQRAEKVYNLLLERGVNAKAIQFKGYSDVDLANNSSTSKNKEKVNSRVDFLLKKGN